MNEATYVSMSLGTNGSTEISAAVHETISGEIPAVHIGGYPVAVSIHVTRQSLRNLIDACLTLQAQLAERERATCPT